MSDETAKMYETMTDDDLAHFWNKGKMIDDDGTLEEELMFRGFKDLYRSNGRRNRRLDAGVSPRARCAIMRASSSSASSRVLQDFHCCVPFTRADTTHALPRRAECWFASPSVVLFSPDRLTSERLDHRHEMP